MARTFTTGNRLSITSPAAWTSAGSVFWRFKPSWNGADSIWHSCWSLFKGSADARCHFEQYSNNTIYAGWYTPGTDSRISLSGSGQFSSGTWANWLITWDSATPLTTLYRNNSSVGSSSGSLSFVTFTPAALTVGAEWESNTGSDGDIAEWARWDHVLDSTERATLESTGNPACLSTGLLHHYKVLGNDSPEPDEVGSEDLTVTGSPTQSTHPTVGSCSSDETAILPQLAAGGSVYAPTVVPATLTLTLPRIEATESIYSPTVSAGAVTAVLPAISADGAAYAPTVAPGTVTETLPLIGATGELYAPTVVEAGTTAVLPQLAANGAFYSPTIIFDQTLTLPQLAAAGALYAPSVVENLAAGIRVTLSNAPVLNLTLADASVLTLTASDDLAEG